MYTVRVYIKNVKNMSKLIIMTLVFPSREEEDSFKTVTERIKLLFKPETLDQNDPKNQV